jgi:hypothetical protein
MAHPLKHAESRARKFCGKAENYLAIHSWLDESKSFFTDFRYRALRHRAEGILLYERIFVSRPSTTKATGAITLHRRTARAGGSGRIPTGQDRPSQVKAARWMYGQRFERDDSELHL